MEPAFALSGLGFFDPNPDRTCWHYVYFHEGDADLIDAVCRYLAPCMQARNAAVVVITPEHLDALYERAPHFGLDLRAATEEKKFVAIEARPLLARFMVDGMPDPERFRDVITHELGAVAMRNPHLHIFGEAVALLQADGNLKAALALEGLWNALGRMHPFSLLCAYPRIAFAAPSQVQQLLHVCDAHVHAEVGG